MLESGEHVAAVDNVIADDPAEEELAEIDGEAGNGN
jgi:hypothetical protein